MKRTHLLIKISWTFIIVVFLLSGCRSKTPPVEFYTLTAMSEEHDIAGTNGAIAIGVGPMEIPEILDRPQIVTRTGTNKFHVSEFHRWGGSMHKNSLRVLKENLSILLMTNQVAVYPWGEHFQPDYRVVLDVQQFDGRQGESVILNVTWTLTAHKMREVLLVRKSLIKEQVSGNHYEALVSAKSRALAALSRQIASEIKRLHILQ